MKNLFIILLIISNLYFNQNKAFCFENISQGIIFTENQVKKLRINIDTKSSVISILGSPSVIDPFKFNRWFYIFYDNNKYKLTNVNKLVLIFNDKDILIDIKR